MATQALTPTTAGKMLAGLKVTRVGDREHNTNMLIYGDYGVGKTRLACSAAAVEEMSPVLLIDMEAGTLSVRDHYPDVEMVRVTTIHEFQAAYDWLRSEGAGEYKTVILDSLTEIQNFMMTGTMKQVHAEDPDRDPDIPGWPEYRKNLEQVRRLVRAFRDLPCHTIMTALEDYDKDETTRKTAFMPLMTGKAQKEIPAFFDLLLRMYVAPDTENEGEVLRLLQSRATEKVKAKDRSGRMPSVLGQLEAPTMAHIYEIALKYN